MGLLFDESPKYRRDGAFGFVFDSNSQRFLTVSSFISRSTSGWLLS
ncbi:MAG: hypothetical protein GQE15_33525 [Archangiaceae bacterium]|nr:hypothetical protein [Archangiaceae bacterium]